MAKKEEQGKVTLERTYIIPLSRELLKVPYYRKAKKAVRTVRAFMQKHMKSPDVLIGRHLNMKLWQHGIKNPPKNVKVSATKDDKGVVRVELFGAPIDAPKKKEEKKTAKPAQDIKPVSEKTEQKESQQEKAQEMEKEDVKELKKELPKRQHHAKKQPKEPHTEEMHPRAPAQSAQSPPHPAHRARH